MATKGKGQLPKTSRWYCAGLDFLMLLLFHVTANDLFVFSRASKSNKKTASATGVAVQADTNDLNQPTNDLNQPTSDINQPRALVTLNDYNEYATSLL